MECEDERERALLSHTDFEMHRRIHGGGVTKAHRNESGIQGEDGLEMKCVNILHMSII